MYALVMGLTPLYALVTGLTAFCALVMVKKYVLGTVLTLLYT